MKKYILNLLPLCLIALSFTACSEDEGTMPGRDSKPSVVVYTYEPEMPYNADNDVTLRFATNNQVETVYYLVEAQADYDSRVTSLGTEGYEDYIVENGTEVQGVDGESNVDVTITDLYGPYVITAVAVAGNQKTSFSTTFTGLQWEDVVTGTYYFNATSALGNIGLTAVETTLQVCTTDDTMYRFPDLFGKGYSLKINLIDYQGTDADGTYQFFRVPSMTTPYAYGDYGAVGVRDIGYWQGNSAFVTEGGYESGMYEDYYCFLYVQYFVSAGNLGYGYDYFVPNN